MKAFSSEYNIRALLQLHEYTRQRNEYSVCSCKGHKAKDYKPEDF